MRIRVAIGRGRHGVGLDREFGRMARSRSVAATRSVAMRASARESV